MGLTPAAELSWALLMACARRIPSALDHVKAGKWIHIPKQGPFTELFHKMLLQKNGFERGQITEVHLPVEGATLL